MFHDAKVETRAIRVQLLQTRGLSHVLLVAMLGEGWVSSKFTKKKPKKWPELRRYVSLIKTKHLEKNRKKIWIYRPLKHSSAFPPVVRWVLTGPPSTPPTLHLQDLLIWGNPPKMGIQNSKHFQVMWNHLRMGFLGSKLESINSPYLISSIITFLTNPRFTGHQRFFMYKCRMLANCMLTVLLWKYSWKGYCSWCSWTCHDNKNVLVACTNKNGSHQPPPCFVQLSPSGAAPHHVTFLGRAGVSLTFRYIYIVFRRLEPVKDEGAVSIFGGLQTPYHFRVLFGAATWLAFTGLQDLGLERCGFNQHWPRYARILEEQRYLMNMCNEFEMTGKECTSHKSLVAI